MNFLSKRNSINKRWFLIAIEGFTLLTIVALTVMIGSPNQSVVTSDTPNAVTMFYTAGQFATLTFAAFNASPTPSNPPPPTETLTLLEYEYTQAILRLTEIKKGNQHQNNVLQSTNCSGPTKLAELQPSVQANAVTLTGVCPTSVSGAIIIPTSTIQVTHTDAEIIEIGGTRDDELPVVPLLGAIQLPIQFDNPVVVALASDVTYTNVFKAEAGDSYLVEIARLKGNVPIALTVYDPNYESVFALSLGNLSMFTTLIVVTNEGDYTLAYRPAVLTASEPMTIYLVRINKQ